MKLCPLALFCLIFACSMVMVVADTIADPMQAFVKLCHLSSSRIVYRWAVDFNNDGRQEILLELKLTSQEMHEEEKEEGWNPQTKNEHGFIVYVKKHNNSDYFQITTTDFGIYTGDGTGLSVDVTHCFVGNVTQLNRWGVVTVDYEPAGRKNSASNTVVAYILEGDHLKVTHLAQYDPDKGGNAIYDQYLSEKNRTSIKLEEITVK